MIKQAKVSKNESRGSRSGRYSASAIYEAAGRLVESQTPPAQSRKLLRDRPPIIKDKRGMATDYSCKLAPKNIARIKLERRSERHFWIDWVFVPPAHRASGLGRRLMNEVVADANLHGVRLSLEARACAGLSQESLEEWYGRFGFVKTPFRGDFGAILVRAPERQARRLAA
jgi:GNAT superfamily N-acetyltransferase